MEYVKQYYSEENKEHREKMASINMIVGFFDAKIIDTKKVTT